MTTHVFPKQIDQAGATTGQVLAWNGSKWAPGAGGSTGGVNDETPSGVVNGANVTFTLTNTPLAGSLLLFVDGVRQTAIVDYTITGAAITMTVAPVTGSTVRATYWTATPGLGAGYAAINVKNNGAHGDGVTDDTAILNTLFSAGGTFYIPPGVYVISGALFVSGVEVHIYGEPGSVFKVGSSGSIAFSNCQNSSVVGMSFLGPMGSQTQYALVAAGIVTAFGTPSYNDGTSTVSGADFTHTLAGNNLTVSLLTLPNLVIRNVVSDYITLNASNRYIVMFQRGFVTGDGANDYIITRYDGSNTLLGTYTINDSSNWYACISGTTKIKISLGAYKYYHTATGQTCVYDLSKIVIYQVTNDGALINLAGSSPGNSAGVIMGNCKNCLIQDCSFTMFPMTALQFAFATQCRATRNTVTFSYQGISFTSGTENLCDLNFIDLRLKDGSGNLIDNRFLRMRGIAGSSEDELDCRNNQLRGAAWGVEILAYTATRTTRVCNNDISAAFTGVSCADGVNNRVVGNDIRLSPNALFGVEVTGSVGVGNFDCICSHNTITCEDFAQASFGISLNKSVRAVVSSNQIRATIGIFCASNAYNQGPYVVEKNDITFSVYGIYMQYSTVKISRNALSINGNGGWFGTPAQAALYVQSYTPDVARITYNEIESTSTYGLLIANCSHFLAQGNVIHDTVITGRPYSCWYIPSSGAYTVTLLKNTWTTWTDNSTHMQFAAGAAAGSIANINDNINALGYADYPGNALTANSVVRMSRNLVGYNVGWAPGTLAAGAYAESPHTRCAIWPAWTPCLSLHFVVLPTT